MMSSSDKFFEMLQQSPEQNTPVEGREEMATIQIRALARAAVALYHWRQTAGDAEAMLEAAGDKEAAARMRIAREEISDAIKDAGIEIDDPMGKTLPEIIDTVSVIGWRQQPGATREVVCQVIEPVVRHGRSVIRRGKVIMGRGPASANEPPREIS